MTEVDETLYQQAVDFCEEHGGEDWSLDYLVYRAMQSAIQARAMDGAELREKLHNASREELEEIVITLNAAIRRLKEEEGKPDGGSTMIQQHWQD